MESEKAYAMKIVPKSTLTKARARQKVSVGVLPCRSQRKAKGKESSRSNLFAVGIILAALVTQRHEPL